MSESPTTPQPESNPTPEQTAPAVPLTRAQARAASGGGESPAAGAPNRPEDGPAASIDAAPPSAEVGPAAQIGPDGARRAGAPAGPAAETGPAAPATEPAGSARPDPGTEATGDDYTGPEVPAVLDEGTYTAVREPRRSGGLVLDGQWHQISPKYVVSQFVQNAIFLAIVIAAAVVVQIVIDAPWPWIPAGVIVLVTLPSLIILPRQARALGYMLRPDDIVFRKGILWQRMVAVPYGRMQLVDITHGPMDRAFGIAKLKMVTAAATTGVEIPGLGQQAAEALRDTLIDVAETRRTGL